MSRMKFVRIAYIRSERHEVLLNGRIDIQKVRIIELFFY
jgi:hypothetical protein